MPSSWIRRIQLVAVLLISVIVIGGTAAAQTATAACPAFPASPKPLGPNLFNAQQEEVLGDAYAEIEDASIRLVNDPVATAYLDKIGKRLLAVLPPSEFHFRYKIVDSWEVNGLSIAGGHVYLTRKLIAAASNEDQIAGVLAHELGHILIHQQAVETTAALKYWLNVTSVGDRADVLDKVQRLREAENYSMRDPADEKDQELVDGIAVYALMKAGYLPSAYADFWNQVAQTKGKTGSVMGGIFHTTRPGERRLREILKNVSAIPASCITATSPSISPEFVAWREHLAADSTTIVAGDSDEKAIQLNPRLQSDLTQLRFSPDGKYALAQNSSTISVLGRSPLRVLFQIDAEDADPASFSPDSKRVSFSTSSMRVEQWDVASAKSLGAYDVLAYRRCLMHLLSPDGHVMACVVNTSRTKPQLGLTLWDVESGDVILQQDEAFDLSSRSPTNAFGYNLDAYDAWWITNKLHWPLVRWAFTPDGKRLMAVHEPTTLIYDVDQHSFVKAEGVLAKLNRRPYAFVGNDRILIVNWGNPQKSAIYSFPEGKEVKQLAMGDQELHSVTRGDYVLLTPMKDAPLGVLQLATGQVPLTVSNNALDIYDNTVLMETPEGGVAVTSQGLVPGAKDSESLDLPSSALGKISAIAVSPDGGFAAISNESRCSVWNLKTGERLFAMRPFSGGFFDESDRFYGDFPKYRGQEHLQAVVDPRQRKSFKLSYAPSEHAEQLGDVLTEFKAVDQTLNYRQSGDFEVRDVKTNQVLWTRHSVQEAPDLTEGGAPNELVLTFDILYAGPGAHELKDHPELVAQQKALKNPSRGVLVEVVDRQTGNYLRGVVTDVRHSRWAWESQKRLRARAFGDFALVEGALTTTAMYRFSTGARIGEVFGRILAQDAGSGLFCVKNRDNDLEVYDAATLGERKHFMYAAGVSYAQFIPRAKELLVFTTDQRVHTISIDDLQSSRAERAAVQ